MDTIIESDKVLVMRRGKLIEYAAPSVLLNKQKGYFTRMVEARGPEVAKRLKERAHTSP